MSTARLSKRMRAHSASMPSASARKRAKLSENDNAGSNSIRPPQVSPLKICRKLRLPFAHEDQSTFHGLTVVDQLQLADWRCLVPLEMFREERQRFALVGRVEIVELITLCFEHGDPLGLALALHGKDEVRIDFGLLPPLNTVLRPRDVSVPPGERLFAVEIDGHIPLVAVQLVLIDRSEQALFERAARAVEKLARVLRFRRSDAEGHPPVAAIEPQAELDMPRRDLRLEQGFGAGIPCRIQALAQLFHDEAGELSELRIIEAP